MKKNDSDILDPIAIFLKWYEEAQGKRGAFLKNRVISQGFNLIRRLLAAFLPWSGLLRPDIATLSTVTKENKPAARSVLFKGFVNRGFSFYTDYDSKKGKELEANPSAVMVFYWHLPPRQVRIDGRVQKLPREQAESDWKARRRENQAASSAFPQSSIIRNREELVEKVNSIKRRYTGKPIPCPESWGGYCLIPETIEFWQGSFDWLHQRERFVRKEDKWDKLVLAP